jgi:hypothetical protein
MNPSRLHRRFARRAVVTILALALLSACGGDGSVGSGGTGADVGQIQGTVNGFGSIIIDGGVYDVRTATVVQEVTPGQDATAEAKLGHRVSVEYTSPGVAASVRIEPALVGAVSALTAGGMTVLGQNVTVNGRVSAGPPTVFGGGYTGLGDVRVGDSVEIHGIVVPAAVGYSLQATRVERTDAPAWLHVTGLVAALASPPTAFMLGALAVDARNATVLPVGSSLANGDAVTVLAPASGLTSTATASPRIAAAQIRKAGLREASLDTYVSGRVASLDTLAKTFRLGAQRVRYGSASIAPSTTALAEGNYVQVRGAVATDSVLDAAVVTVRADDSASEVELRGNVLAYDALSGQFVVRGVLVDGRTASIRGCPAAGLADGLYVEVHGTSAGAGVVASSIACERESADSTIEREGRAGSVDVAAMTFTLTTESGSLHAVRWSATTYFGSVTPQTLAGKKVEVEGSLSGSTLVATKVKLSD